MTASVFVSEQVHNKTKKGELVIVNVFCFCFLTILFAFLQTSVIQLIWLELVRSDQVDLLPVLESKGLLLIQSGQF